MTFIGIDNGVTGSIGIIRQDGSYDLIKTPCKNEQDYTKKKKNITRIDFKLLFNIIDKELSIDTVKICIERVMINPGRFTASISGARAYESLLICLETLDCGYEVIDSKEWQKPIFPSVKRKEKQDTKALSRTIGKRMYPKIELKRKTDDADGILMANWIMLKYSNFNKPKYRRQRK